MSINDWRSNARPPQQPPPKDFAELNARMAEAERDRRVGAAVMAWNGDDTAADLLAVAEALRADSWPITAGLLEAIAAALREEAGR